MSNSSKIIVVGILVAIGIAFYFHSDVLVSPDPERLNIIPLDSAKNDFDFLIGKKWRVHNQVLKERLAGSDQWEHFECTLTDVRKIIDGLGNIDKFYGYRGGKYFEAASMRIYHPQEKTWTIYWVDNISTRLTFQVVGGFKDGTGIFYGEEPFKGDTVKLRFIWSDISENSAHWEQAYYSEAQDQWEVNWIMDFELND